MLPKNLFNFVRSVFILDHTDDILFFISKYLHLETHDLFYGNIGRMWLYLTNKVRPQLPGEQGHLSYLYLQLIAPLGSTHHA